MVHILRDGADVAIWLDTEVAEYDGICLATGPDVETVRAEAMTALLEAYTALAIWRAGAPDA